MAGVRRFEEFDCWQLSHAFKLEVYEIVKRPPVSRDQAFVAQIREAARSAPRNIAEGFGRRTDAEFARYLDVARGSLAECQNHLRDALDCGYITAPEYDQHLALARRAAAAVAGLQRHLRRRNRQKA